MRSFKYLSAFAALAAAVLLPSCRSDDFTATELKETTISFASSSLAVSVGSTGANPASVSSGAQLTYSSDNESVATVNKSTGTVTGVSEGTANITATCAATDEYASAYASYKVVVEPLPAGTEVTTLEFEYESLSLKVDGTACNPAVASSGATVTYETSDASVASVTSEGWVTAVSEGYATITASVAAVSGFTAASANCRVTVKNSSSQDGSGVDPYNASDEVSTFSPDGTVTVTFSGGSVSLGGDTGLVSCSVSGAGVTVTNPDSLSIKYVLSGSSSNGYFKLYSGRKQLLELDGLDLRNQYGAAINNQSKKRTFVVLTGTNKLADGPDYTLTPSGEDEKAAFFSEGQLCFSGKGSLQVTATGKAGITSDDYLRFMGGTVTASSSAGHALRGKDAVIVSSGTISASSSADMKKAVSSDGFYQQDGGTVSLSTTGNAAYDSSEGDVTGAPCMKVDGNFVMNAGTLSCVASGKGAKAISVDGAAFFCGGAVDVKASGSNFQTGGYHSYAKAIKCDGSIDVSGGLVNASSAAHEGMTTDGSWNQSGGVVIVTGKDDAVNSASNLTVSGGYLRGTSSGNDGIDANSSITINGGVVIGEGAGAPECGIDSVEGTYVTINGGYVISRGGSVNPFTTTSGKAFVTMNLSSGATIGINSGDTQLVAYQAPSSGGTVTLVSDPSMQAGSTYTVYTGVSGITLADPDFPRFGYNYTGGSGAATLTASSSSGNGGTGGGGGGTPPGGGGGRPGGGGPGGW